MSENCDHDFDVKFSSPHGDAKELRKECNRCKVTRIELTPDELDLLREALDSHAYWQVSEDFYRNNGFIAEPGADCPDAVEELKQIDALSKKLGGEAITFTGEEHETNEG